MIQETIKRVVFKEYNLAEDMFTFSVECDSLFQLREIREDVHFTGEEIRILLSHYETNRGNAAFLSRLGIAIIEILHDQNEIDSDDPTEFVGRAWEF